MPCIREAMLHPYMSIALCSPLENVLSMIAGSILSLVSKCNGTSLPSLLHITASTLFIVA